MSDGIKCPKCGQTTTLIAGGADAYPFYCPACETLLNSGGHSPTVTAAPLTMQAVKETITDWATTIREERGGTDAELRRILEFLDKLET